LGVGLFDRIVSWPSNAGVLITPGACFAAVIALPGVIEAGIFGILGLQARVSDAISSGAAEIALADRVAAIDHCG